MNIRKLSHCCLIIEVKTPEGMRRIMTDPGIYSLEMHEKAEHIDVVLITHEHGDHFHIESLKNMLTRMPNLSVISNDAVGEILAKEGIQHHVMKYGNTVDHKGIHIEAYGKKHALMHKSIPAVSNVGFFIENKLFYPGDAFTDPKRPVDVLALPVTGPWMKVSEAVDYALKLKPRMAFPVHDAVRSAFQHTFFQNILAKFGVEFVRLEENQHIDIA